jgi:hypothetical protein
MIVDSRVSDAAQPNSNVIRTIGGVHFSRSTEQGGSPACHLQRNQLIRKHSAKLRYAK